ncbi:MAG: hypothetical protein Kow00107_09330 [Planctomycetota bacterium]
MVKMHRKPNDAKRKLISRVVAGMFILLGLWAFYTFLTHTPTTKTFNPNPETSAADSEPLLPKPVIVKDIGIRAFHYMPAEALGGIYISNSKGAASIPKSFGLLRTLSRSEAYSKVASVLGGLKGDVLICFYPDDKNVIVKGIVCCKNSEEADADFELLSELFDSEGHLVVSGLPPLFVGRVATNISFASTSEELRLLPEEDSKPIPRLSKSRDVQAALNLAKNPVFAFGCFDEIARFLDDKYPPAVKGELPVIEVFKALDLHSVSSSAFSLTIENGKPISRTVISGVGGEGLAGMISDIPTTPSSSKLLPKSTVFFTSQTFDIARFVQAAGGFLALTNKEEHLRLPDEMTVALSELNLSPGLLARAFAGEVSLAISTDGPLPSAWLTLQLGDPKVFESIVAIYRANKLITTSKGSDGRETHIFTKPLLTLGTGSMKIDILPCFTIIGAHCVLASDYRALNTALSVSAGKKPSLESDDEFLACVAASGDSSSTVFARPAAIAKTLAPLLDSTGIDLSGLEGLDEVFWSSAICSGDTVKVTQCSSIPIPFANHLIRPVWIPTAYALAQSYDRTITMLLKGLNWAGSKLCYYDIEHLNISMNLSGEVPQMESEITVKCLVEGSTGYTFLLSPDYSIESVLVDGQPVSWSRKGPLLGVSAPSPLAVDSVNRVTVKASGTPRDMLEMVPPAFRETFRVVSHPTVTEELAHFGPSSLFYPMTTCVREDTWTSSTTLTVKSEWKGVSNGILDSTESVGTVTTFVYKDERPDMALEILAGPFGMLEDKSEGFTITHYFQPGALQDTSKPVDYARRCFQFYVDTFEGEYEPNPVIVHLKEGPGISHCLSYIVIYNRTQTVLSHEIAHLWWGSLVKMDPLASSMWYEGLAEYSNIMFIRQEFGEEYHARYLNWRLNNWRSNDFPPKPFRDIRMWSANRGALGYVKGVAAFRGLHTLLGDEDFTKFLRGFAKRGGSFADIPIIWEEITKVNPDLDWYVRAMFYGTGFFDLAMDSVVEQEPGVWVVTVRAKGQYFWRGDVVIVGESDQGVFRTSFRMEGQTSLEVELRVNGDLKFVSIDPDQEIPELRVNNNLWANKKNSAE